MPGVPTTMVQVTVGELGTKHPFTPTAAPDGVKVEAAV